jgi:hypothetical protein
MSFSTFLEEYIDEDAVLDTSKLCFFNDPEYEGLLGYYEANEELLAGLEEYEGDKIENNIISAAEYKWNELENCMEVVTINAKQGYGPLLYLSMMQLSKGKGLCPTRIKGHVSKEAEVVWEKFFVPPKGKKILAKPIKELKDKIHDNPALNHKYINIYKPKLSSSLINHKKVVRNDRYGEKNSMIIDALEGFIRKKMQDIYQS